MGRNKVARCICHKKTFKEVKAYAEEHDISTIEELQARNFCSNSCQLCAPYVEMILKTGKTEFTPGEPFR